MNYGCSRREVSTLLARGAFKHRRTPMVSNNPSVHGGLHITCARLGWTVERRASVAMRVIASGVMDDVSEKVGMLFMVRGHTFYVAPPRPPRKLKRPSVISIGLA